MLASLSFFKARADFRRCPAFPEFLVEIDVASYRRLRRDLLFHRYKIGVSWLQPDRADEASGYADRGRKVANLPRRRRASALSCAIDRKHKLIHINFLLRHCNRKSGMSRHPLLPEVTIALAVKLIVILAAALFVFSPRQRPRIDAASMQERLIGASTEIPQPTRSVLP